MHRRPPPWHHEPAVVTANAPASALVMVAAAYLLGSIPFGAVLARIKGVDLRKVGSGNIGATNVARAMGKGWAIAVLLADAAKGFVPVWLGIRWQLPALAVAGAGLGAIVGHMFTLFLRGRGGKGVATSLGVSLALSPVMALVGFGVYAVVFALTRLSSLGSLLGVWTFAVGFVAARHPTWPYAALALGGAALVTLRHRANIQRLVKGEEKRLKKA
jgi:glycerol-3-phosphate acyltransferase PlsY